MRETDELNDRLISALARADLLWEAKATPLSPGELACRAGCFGCCVGLFAISLPEALALRHAVARLPESERAAILSRAARAAARGAEVFPGDARAGLLDPARSEKAEDAFFEAVRTTACPVLDLPSGRCAVYAARPTTCRTYGIALVADGRVRLPACELNFAGAPPERIVETGVDAGALLAVDQALAEAGADASLPSGAETTIAHALAGSAFAALDPLPALDARNAKGER